jgi:DNA-binding beta-propeller fold protein YncE
MKIFNALLVLSLTLASIASTPPVYADFHPITRYQLGGDGGWDYLTLDSADRRIYLARSNRIMVLGVDTGKPLGEVPGLDGAHGVALVKKLGLGFATSGKSAEVVVFALSTLKVVGRIQVGEGPDSITYNAAAKRILAFNGKGNGKNHSASVIDPVSLKVVGTIPLAGKPESAVSDSSARIFVGLEDKSLLVEVDPVSMKAVATYPLAPCEEPTGIAMDTKTERIIVGCSNKTAVIVDAHSGKVLQNFKTGAQVDAVAFDTKRKRAGISAGEGILTILSEDDSGRFRLLQEVKTEPKARTLGIDEKTGRAYLPTAQFAPALGHDRPAVIPGSFEVLVFGE